MYLVPPSTKNWKNFRHQPSGGKELYKRSCGVCNLEGWAQVRLKTERNGYKLKNHLTPPSQPSSTLHTCLSPTLENCKKSKGGNLELETPGTAKERDTILKKEVTENLILNSENLATS